MGRQRRRRDDLTNATSEERVIEKPYRITEHAKARAIQRISRRYKIADGVSRSTVATNAIRKAVAKYCRSHKTRRTDIYYDDLSSAVFITTMNKGVRVVVTCVKLAKKKYAKRNHHTEYRHR